MFKSYKSGHDIPAFGFLISPRRTFLPGVLRLNIVVLKLVEISADDYYVLQFCASQFSYYDLNETMHKIVLDL